MTAAILATGFVILAAVLALAWLVDRRVAALANRVDRFAERQADLPRMLAEEGAIQARALADVRDRLGGLAEQGRRLEALGAAVEDVRQIVAVPKLRGALGELWLEELLADVLPAGHWSRQHAFPSGERVDAVIRLDGRLVPVDAKFPLEACRRMLAAEGDDRAREARAFARSVRQRVDEIADRYIRPDEGTYPFALMYVPAEGVYWEAVRLEDDVLGYARGRNVVLVSPNTFYAYLQALAHGLRGLAVEARARDLLAGLAALRQDLDRFDGAAEQARRYLELAGRQLDLVTRLGRDVRDRVGRFADGNPESGGG